MPIRFYSGVEGSGKTCKFTADLYKHYQSGGRILAFPGYELYGVNKRQVLSESIMPWQVLEMLEDDSPKNVANVRKQRFVIAIDEVTNFFNNHNWWSKITDVVAAIAQQRRKLQMAMFMTGHERARLPSNIEEKVHEEIICLDAHKFNRSIPTGKYMYYRHHDLRGMICHPRYPWSRQYSLYLPQWYKHFNTLSIVSLLHMFDKYKFQGNQIIVGPDGKLVDSYEQTGEPAEITQEIIVAQIIQALKDKDINSLNTRELAVVLRDKGLPYNQRIKGVLASWGLVWDNISQSYVIDDSPSPLEGMTGSNSILTGV